jgi:ectoine hydroxylase-related dioxygenase (phytanoyl-CoA dioxygenase family)
VEYGQLLLFDGGLLSHGTVANTSGQTRMSMDLRIAPRAPVSGEQAAVPVWTDQAL